jgi:hypothetical protein
LFDLAFADSKSFGWGATPAIIRTKYSLLDNASQMVMSCTGIACRAEVVVSAITRLFARRTKWFWLSDVGMSTLLDNLDCATFDEEVTAHVATVELHRPRHADGFALAIENPKNSGTWHCSLSLFNDSVSRFKAGLS